MYGLGFRVEGFGVCLGWCALDPPLRDLPRASHFTFETVESHGARHMGGTV